MKKLRLFFITFLTAAGLLSSLLTLPALADLKSDAQCTAGAANCVPTCCDPASPTCTGNDPKNCPQAPGSCTKSNCDLVATYVNPFIKFLGIFLGLAVTIGIAYGGIEYSSSGGDPSKAASGKRHIIMAVIALVSYFFLYAAIKFLMPGS